MVTVCFLQIQPKGSKYWRLKYRFNGKEKLLATGLYPELTILDARQERERARKLLPTCLVLLASRGAGMGWQKSLAEVVTETGVAKG